MTDTKNDLSTVRILHTGFADHPDAIATRVLKAECQLESLEDAGAFAFEATNNPYVTNLAELTIESSGRCYSTSVGDVIEWNGRLAIVVPVGFMEISVREYNRMITHWHAHIEDGVTFRFEVGHHGVTKIKVTRKTMGLPLTTPFTKPGDEKLLRYPMV